MMMERVEVVTVKRNEAVVKHLHGCIVITEVLCEIIIDVETAMKDLSYQSNPFDSEMSTIGHGNRSKSSTYDV
jgi:hypothetical protein